MSTPAPTTQYTAEQIYELAAAGQSIPREFVNIRSDYDGNTALVTAATKGNVAAVRALLDAKADPHITNHNGSTALHAAAWNGSTELIQILLDHGCKVSVQNNSKKTPLHFAASMGNVAAAEKLLAVGAEVHAQDEEGNTPLHHVANSLNNLNSVATIQALRAAGADVNARNQKGNTPLHIAAKQGDIKTVQALLTAGPDPIAASQGDIETVQALPTAGTDPNATNHEGETPLHYVTTKSLADDGVAIIQLLVDAGANPSAKDNRGSTPLHTAVSYDRPKRVRALLNARADVHATDNEGNTPLHAAAKIGSAESIEQLVAAGADPDATNNKGATPLDTAAISIQFKRAIDALPELLAAGAGLWKSFLAANKMHRRGLNDKILEKLDELEQSILNEPFNWPHLNFNQFPQERINELEACLEKLVRHYEAHQEEATKLKSLRLNGVALTEKGLATLARCRRIFLTPITIEYDESQPPYVEPRLFSSAEERISAQIIEHRLFKPAADSMPSLDPKEGVDKSLSLSQIGRELNVNATLVQQCFEKVYTDWLIANPAEVEKKLRENSTLRRPDKLESIYHETSSLGGLAVGGDATTVGDLAKGVKEIRDFLCFAAPYLWSTTPAPCPISYLACLQEVVRMATASAKRESSRRHPKVQAFYDGLVKDLALLPLIIDLDSIDLAPTSNLARPFTTMTTPWLRALLNAHEYGDYRKIEQLMLDKKTAHLWILVDVNQCKKEEEEKVHQHIKSLQDFLTETEKLDPNHTWTGPTFVQLLYILHNHALAKHENAVAIGNGKKVKPIPASVENVYKAIATLIAAGIEIEPGRAKPGYEGLYNYLQILLDDTRLGKLVPPSETDKGAQPVAPALAAPASSSDVTSSSSMTGGTRPPRTFSSAGIGRRGLFGSTAVQPVPTTDPIPEAEPVGLFGQRFRSFSLSGKAKPETPAPGTTPTLPGRPAPGKGG